jgi:hypothetical protein
MARKSSKGKTKAKAQEQAPVAPQDSAPYWEFFFRDQRSPLLRSQMVTALMAVRHLVLLRLPLASLLDAVVLASAARVYHEAEIIDDFGALLRRTDEAWKDPQWTCRVFDQTHRNVADFIIRGLTEFVAYEDLYIPELAKWLLEHDPPEYFSEELAA